MTGADGVWAAAGRLYCSYYFAYLGRLGNACLHHAEVDNSATVTKAVVCNFGMPSCDSIDMLKVHMYVSIYSARSVDAYYCWLQIPINAPTISLH